MERSYDRGSADVDQRLGIPEVGTVRWTSDQMRRRLLPQGSVPEHSGHSGQVDNADVPVKPAWIGRRMSEIESTSGARVVYVTRLGEGMMPGADTVYQDGDLVHVVTTSAALRSIEQILDQTPPVH